MASDSVRLDGVAGAAGSGQPPAPLGDKLKEQAVEVNEVASPLLRVPPAGAAAAAAAGSSSPLLSLSSSSSSRSLASGSPVLMGRESPLSPLPASPIPFAAAVSPAGAAAAAAVVVAAAPAAAAADLDEVEEQRAAELRQALMVSYNSIIESFFTSFEKFTAELIRAEYYASKNVRAKERDEGEEELIKRLRSLKSGINTFRDELKSSDLKLISDYPYKSKEEIVEFLSKLLKLEVGNLLFAACLFLDKSKYAKHTGSLDKICKGLTVSMGKEISIPGWAECLAGFGSCFLSAETIKSICAGHVPPHRKNFFDALFFVAFNGIYWTNTPFSQIAKDSLFVDWMTQVGRLKEERDPAVYCRSAQMFMIEQTNRLRQKMGLPALQGRD